jgi:hypothetical protein
MAATTVNMLLKQWNAGGDFFSYSDLSANWGKVDLHDHTSNKGVPIPAGGIATSAVTTAKIAGLAVDASKIASDAVTTAKILNANVTDAKLASPNNGLYRTLACAPIQIAGSTAVNTYVLFNNGLGASGSSYSGLTGVGLLRINSTDLAVTSKTTYLRTLIAVAVNAAALGGSVTAKVGLYPVTSTGGAASNLSITLGTVVASSEVTIANSWASNVFNAVSSDFALPANGTYVIGLAVSGATTASASYVQGTAEVQVHNA